MFGYDPKTLKNNLVYVHEVEAERATAPKPKPQEKKPAKPSAEALTALQEKFGRKK